MSKNLKNITLISLLLSLTLWLAGTPQPAQNDPGASGPTRETEGTLSFSVRTVTYNGPYAPANAGVIWITNAASQFVKTIKVWANQYRYTLVRWNASSGGNTQGAITGASLNNHILHNVTWNGTNAQGAQVPDGDYKINVEFTEHNASAANMGKYFQYTFSKGPSPIDITLPNQTYFRDLTLTWQPVAQDGFLDGYVVNGTGAPVHQAQLTAGGFTFYTGVDGYYIQSLPPGMYTVVCSHSGYGTQTVTGVEILAEQATSLNFTLDPVSGDDPLAPETVLTLGSPSPNPFTEYCRLAYTGKQELPALLEIFNSRGQKVRTLSLSGSQAGEAVWDGRDERGAKCPAGIYLARLSQGGSARVRKLLRVN